MTDGPNSAELPNAPRHTPTESSPRAPSPGGFSDVLAQASRNSGDAEGTAPLSLGGAAPPDAAQVGGSGDAGPSPFGLEAPPWLCTEVGAEVTEVLLAAQAVSTRRGGGQYPGEAKRASRGDPLDPATRQAAQLAPPFLENGSLQAATIPSAPSLVRAHASLEDVLPAIVRRIAWSGDGRKGSVRLEFGAGALAGGTLVVHADDGRVRVELSAPPGADASAWKERIVSRLEERRLHVEEVIVE
jgi:hypothetical protein